MTDTLTSPQGSTPTTPASSAPSGSSQGSGSARPRLGDKILTAHNELQGKPQSDSMQPQRKPDMAGEAPVDGQQAKPAEAQPPVTQEQGGKAQPNVVEYDGRRFDFSDPNKVAKKLVDLDKGMRLFQKERDQLKIKLQEHEANSPAVEQGKAFGEVQRKYNAAMKHALGEDGAVRNARALVAGVDVFMNDMLPPEVLNQWLNHKLQMNMHVMNLSPEQRDTFNRDYQDRQDVEQQRIQVELERGEIDQFKSAKVEAEERAEREQLKAVITPIRQKHSFSNTIKDPRTAAFLDKQLWFEAKAQMKQALDQGLTLDEATTEKIFSSIKNELTLGQQGAAKEAVTQEVRRAKDGAMSGILDAATSGAAPTDDIEDLYKKGAKSADIFRARIQGLTGKR